MRLPVLASFLVLLPALMPGQDKATSIYPGPYYNDVKQYLTLSDAQIQSLQSILDSRNQALQAIYTQINQKNDTLYQLLNSGTGSPSQLGQLLIDIQTLQKQLPLNDGPYKSQVQNVLTADQKAKLPKLTEALQLQSAGSQAAMLLLIDYPPYSGRPVFIGGVEALSATGSSGVSSQIAPAARLQLPAGNR